MDHEAMEELVALSVYGEADAREQALVDEHLEECAECRALRSELDSWPGRDEALRPAESPMEMAELWEREMAVRGLASEAAVSVRGRLVPVLSFAAGVLLTLLFHRGGERPKTAPPRNEVAPRFAAETPPVPAPSRGRLGGLARLRNRR